MGETCSMHEWEEICTKILVRNPEGDKPGGKTRRKREDDIKMDRTGKERESIDLSWIRSGQGLMIGFCEHGNEPSGSYLLHNDDL
jgi:hypothetical protein